MKNKILAFALIAAVAALYLKSRNPEVQLQAAAHGAAETEKTSTAVKVAPPSASQTAAPAVAAPVPVSADQRLEKLANLSAVVVNSPAKIAALRPLLADETTVRMIGDSLRDPNSFAGERFTRKLRLMDAMYDGMKFPDAQIRDRYFKLAADIVNEQAPAEFGTDRELHRQFLADRAEIAVALLANFPQEARRIRDASGPEGRAAFEQASRLKSTYDIAL